MHFHLGPVFIEPKRDRKAAPKGSRKDKVKKSLKDSGSLQCLGQPAVVIVPEGQSSDIPHSLKVAA